MWMHGKNMCALCWVMCLLVIVGALNWGLVGLAMLFSSGGNWNVVNLLLGAWPMVEAIVYVLVGVAGVYKLFMYGKCCGKCCEKCANPTANKGM
jgi:uncharacterized membrane protein YuzA (DUF378 family)